MLHDARCGMHVRLLFGISVLPTEATEEEKCDHVGEKQAKDHMTMSVTNPASRFDAPSSGSCRFDANDESYPSQAAGGGLMEWWQMHVTLDQHLF